MSGRGVFERYMKQILPMCFCSTQNRMSPRAGQKCPVIQRPHGPFVPLCSVEIVSVKQNGSTLKWLNPELKGMMRVFLRMYNTGLLRQAGRQEELINATTSHVLLSSSPPLLSSLLLLSSPLLAAQLYFWETSHCVDDALKTMAA